MKLEFTLSLADYKAALKLHRRQKLIRRFLPWIWPTLLLICVIGFICSSVAQSLELAGQSISLGAGALVATIGFPIARWINTRRCYSRMFPPSRTSPVTTIEIDESRIVEDNPGAEEIRVGWAGVLDFIQNEKITLIYIGVGRFFLFPTPILSQEQRAELNDLVKRHLARGKK
jgi:hypothetical protein